MDIQSRYSQILDVAERKVRKRGYNAFSFADIASELRVSKATIHHHFPTKCELGLALIIRFEETVLELLDEIERTHANNLTKLAEYASIFEGSFQENKMCLCGMLAAEHETLCERMQDAINVFFENNEKWIEKTLIAGQNAGELQFNGSALEQAQMFVANLQGALLIAKSMKSYERLNVVTRNLVNSFRSA